MLSNWCAAVSKLVSVCVFDKMVSDCSYLLGVSNKLQLSVYFLSIHLICTFSMFRDNGLKAIENLMEKKGKFDYILLETTGLADPGDLSTLCFFHSIFVIAVHL